MAKKDSRQFFHACAKREGYKVRAAEDCGDATIPTKGTSWNIRPINLSVFKDCVISTVPNLVLDTHPYIKGFDKAYDAFWPGGGITPLVSRPNVKRK
jgi:hypothetical protein